MKQERQRPRGFEKIKSTLKDYPYPAVVIIEALNRCNLRCIMCPQDKLTRAVGVMPEYLYRKIIDDIVQHAPQTTQVWLAIMGETLLLKEKAVDYIRYAVDRGITDLNLNTNLVPADEKLCAALVGTQLSKIIVGLDAATRETYEKIRVGGDFERVMANIDTILRVKAEHHYEQPELVLQYIVQDENEHEVELFKDLFRSKKVSLKIRPRLGWGGQGVAAPGLPIKGNVRDYPCPWLNRTMSIHVTGQVAQCDAAWNGRYYYGDLNFQSITEVWNGTLAQLRKRHWNGDFDFEPCASCNDWQCGLAEWISCGAED